MACLNVPRSSAMSPPCCPMTARAIDSCRGPWTTQHYLQVWCWGALLGARRLARRRFGSRQGEGKEEEDEEASSASASPRSQGQGGRQVVQLQEEGVKGGSGSTWIVGSPLDARLGETREVASGSVCCHVFLLFSRTSAAVAASKSVRGSGF